MSFFKLWNKINEAAEHYVPELVQELKSNPDPDLWVHFTWGVPEYGMGGPDASVPKIGIRPSKSTHSDPVGVYAFPKKYILSGEINRNQHFVGMSYAYILKLKPGLKILNLHTLSSQEAEQLLAKMNIKIIVDDSKTPGEMFWRNLVSSAKNWHGYNTIGPTKALRAINIDAVYDETGIIHYNEKKQIIIINPTGYKVLKLIRLGSIGDRVKKLAWQFLALCAKAFFDGEYQVHKSKHYSEQTLYANGTYKGRATQLYLSYYVGEDNRYFHGKLNVSIRTMKPEEHGKYTSMTQDVAVPVEDEVSLEIEAKRVVTALQSLLSNREFREPKDDKVQQFANEVSRLFGLTKPPVVKDERVSIDRRYKLGLLNVSLSYHDKEDLYSLHVNIKLAPGESVRVSGKSEVYKEPKDVKQMIHDAIDDAEYAIYKYYNPDPEKHGNSYSKWEYARKGEQLLQLIKFIRERVV